MHEPDVTVVLCFIAIVEKSPDCTLLSARNFQPKRAVCSIFFKAHHLHVILQGTVKICSNLQLLDCWGGQPVNITTTVVRRGSHDPTLADNYAEAINSVAAQAVAMLQRHYQRLKRKVGGYWLANTLAARLPLATCSSCPPAVCQHSTSILTEMIPWCSSVGCQQGNSNKYCSMSVV